MVLTQPRIINVTVYNDKYVSIPLWFLRNPTSSFFSRVIERKFPYHYGSYATSTTISE